ncbi:MAG: hypothetical protein R3E18_01490 [Sphingomonadaceae bacterium]|nr:hypothetical protein [Sphingomonadaceae bacterium]
MYSQDEINSAVAAGALSQDAADALRSHVVALRHRPVTDEEHFRLINSFNDIFVAIGAIIMLVAAGAIGQAIASGIFPTPTYSGSDMGNAAWQAYRAEKDFSEYMQMLFMAILVAGTAWPLAEFFTRKRRMALPSILLLIAFVGGVFAACVAGALALIDGAGDNKDQIGAAMIAISGLVAAGAAWAHWRRFMVPITVAAGAAGMAITAVGLLLAALNPEQSSDTEALLFSLIFIAGLCIFGFAMWWDMSDRERKTRRADVAFWLHLLAAPMIAHPVFHLLGVTDGRSIGVGAALAVLVVYILFGLVALAIDRRALLVSALAYVLVALTYLFDEFGAVELNVALTALVIGSALLSLSAFWSPIRSRLVSFLPGGMQDRLPVTAALPA